MSVDDRAAVGPGHQPTVLLEREPELATIREALEAAADRTGGFVLIEGEAGIGKSSLLEHAIDMAAGMGLRVARGRGGELETRFPNGIVLDLFALFLRSSEDRAARLTGLAAAAEPVFRPSSRTSSPADPMAAVHGLYWLTVELSDEAPLLLVVDDAHWGDDPSLRYLHYLARRIGDLPVLLLVAMRPPEREESDALAGLRGHPRAVRLLPARLSEPAVGTMMAERGEAIDAAAVHACWDATRGNPLYVREMLRRSASADEAPAASGATDPLARAIRHRIGLLSDDPRRVAEAVALLGDEATIGRIARMTGMTPPRVDEVVRRLAASSVLEAGDGLSFIHPVVRTTVIDSIPTASRASLHRAASTVLDEDLASPEAIAVQLLGAERRGDARAVTVLREAARSARAQGDAQTAVAYLKRALAEPPAPTERGPVTAELASGEAAIGSPQTIGHYEEAMALARDDHERAALLLQMAHAQIAAADWVAAAASFRSGMGLAGEADAELAAELEAGYIAAAWVTMTGVEEAESRLDRVQTLSEITPQQRELLVSRSFQQATAARGQSDEIGQLVLRAIDSVSIDDLVRAGQTIELTTGVLVNTDELVREIELLDAAIEAVPRTGVFSKLGVYSYCRAWPKYFMGRLIDAAADAQAAVRAHEMGWETFLPAASAVLASALVDRDELDAAQAAIDAVDPEQFGHRLDYNMPIPIARGRILLARGEAAAAAKEFLAAGSAAQAMGVRNGGPTDWRSWAAVSLARSGDRDQARGVAEEAVEIARAWGARWPTAIALRALGMVVGGRDGLDLLEESVWTARTSPSTLELTRSLYEQGAALRRQGHLNDARRALTEGMDLAHSLGAVRLQALARHELVVAGARPRRYAATGVDALTPAEWRVAQLVATGKTNREAAEALFVTPKAVEYHLANAYRKLGISGRAELAGALEPAAEAASV